MLKKCIIAATAVVALGTNVGHAGTATVAVSGGNLQVNATVLSSCQAAAGAAVAFGTIGSFAIANTATGNVQVTCDVGVPYAIGLGLGTNASGSVRRMSGIYTINGVNTTYFLPYELYADAAFTTPITDITTGVSGSTTGSATAATPGGTGTNLPQTVSVFGRIAAGTTKPPPATYGDVVTITVGY